MKKEGCFKISYHNAGFFIEFKNGITISTQFAPGTYCKNYDEIQKDGMKRVFCQDSEIAIMKDKTFITDEVYKRLYKRDLNNDIMIHILPEEWGMIFIYVFINYVIPELKDEIKKLKFKRR